MGSGFIGIVEDVMRLQLRCHSDIDLSLPGMQAEIRSHIARWLRDYPTRGEGVITLAGVEYCFMYVVQNDVVDTVIGPPDYIEQVFNEGRQDMQEGQSVLPRKDHD
jgi:hypothetical protein